MVFEAIRRQLGRSMPLARLLGIEVEEIDARHARTGLGARAELCNHHGTVHAGALFTVCESASAAALAGAMADVIMCTRFLRDVGLQATRAIHDFAIGRYTDAAERLRQIRPVAQRFGDSHAQRDLIDQTLIEAAARAGNWQSADALRRERALVRG